MSLCINPNCNHQNPSNLHFCEHCDSELLLQGRYRATKILGKGGFGQTYEICSRDETKVLKVLINNSPKAVDLFKREAEVLSKINYPGIPKFDSYFSYKVKDSQASLHCLVMEKIEGLNLRQYIKQKGQPINSELALKWLKELLLILNEIHSQGILHRDIKPDNIILDPYGKLFLIDFGAVKEGEISEGTEIATKTQNVTETKTGTSIHSGGYTAREQINGQARIESDIYSLGCTFVYLLTGKEPNSKDNYDSYNDKIDWQKNAFGIAPQLAEVIDVMIATRASDRFKSCRIILDTFFNNQKERSHKISKLDEKQKSDSKFIKRKESNKNTKLYISLELVVIALSIIISVRQYSNRPFSRKHYSYYWDYSTLINNVQSNKVETIKLNQDLTKAQIIDFEGTPRLVELPKDPRLMDILMDNGVDVAVVPEDDKTAWFLLPILTVGLLFLFHKVLLK